MKSREMKKIFAVFVVLACAVTCVSQAAVNIKKAAPVATKKASATESATSLVPTVFGLVSGVQNLQAQQQQLTADCTPTSDEINTVNDLVKEWAKLGETKPEDAYSGLGNRECTGGFQTHLELDDEDDKCYEIFKTSADQDTVWYNFPKVSSGKKCKDGNKNCTIVTNMYEIFEKIPFSNADYTKAEATKIVKLKEKAERCSPSRIKAAKAELYGGFLTQTLSSVGQSTGAAGTTSVLNAVSSMGGSGDLKSMLPSLGSMATQMVDK